MERYFIITIDTESDNQWISNSKLTTDNSRYIPRFQNLCEKYGFKPVYLTDYTMANDDYYIDYIREKSNSGLCEVGMHLHAWDTPPITDYNNGGGKPYLIEYPDEVMYEKISAITEILEQRLKTKMVSHRAGRWALDKRYIDLLEKLGYRADCSVTPGINWSKFVGKESGGSNYSASKSEPHFLTEKKQLLEVPMTIKKLKMPFKIKTKSPKALLKSAYHSVCGKNIWLRPSVSTPEEIDMLLNTPEIKSGNYIEFMMHSSEFMPGGSPYFKDDAAIEKLYSELDVLFEKISSSYRGITLKDFCGLCKEDFR